MHQPLLQRARELGLPLNPPANLYNTRKALELTEYARARGRHEPLHRALFKAFFVDGLNLADPQVLAHLAREAGLDPEDAMDAVERGDFRAPVQAAITQARGWGITGVPTFIIDDEYKIVGAQPYEVLRDALLRIQGDQN